MIKVILDADDCDALLRCLYHGARPVRVHTLLCGCGAQADLRKSPHAWNGWRVLPAPMCPHCMARLFPYPHEARARFLALLERLS
jgi:hypothetical protein